MTHSAMEEVLSSLQNSIRLQAALMAKLEQRDRQTADRFHQHMQSLHDQAQSALAPATIRYDRAVESACVKLQAAQRTVSVAFALAGSSLLLFLLVGWLLLGYYRRELQTVQSELQRHEQAIPILQAYAASDAMLCDGRICVNIDPAARPYGDQRRYRPAKPRE
ncbi:hypothetical protein [Pseudoxanthomonas sp.]|uniref:hypothetical protein n=1 Tax=Pseudoxanthomonas sp. TaxID=1871049 RepID=UPI0025F98D82|nr:hypothetical protein [Pseudoxanthomonas sp.]